MSVATRSPPGNTLADLVHAVAQRFEAAQLSYGHGTDNAFDEAAWLCLWALKLPLDSDLAQDLDEVLAVDATVQQQYMTQLWLYVQQRMDTRKPLAYLTREAWLHGLSFYVDERCIVPRSPIATLLCDDEIAPYLLRPPKRILDLCTGNGSLAIFAALLFPQATVDALDISTQALQVAAINCKRHQVQERVRLLPSDALGAAQGRYDLILCNPPYVTAQSMQQLPAEYQAEPALALDGGVQGMDFIDRVLPQLAGHMSEGAQLVLEVGFEEQTFMQRFAALEPSWFDTQGDYAQSNAAVCLIAQHALLRWSASHATNLTVSSY